ncbi:TPA: type I DNA topoisomerase [Aeromonas salmonicida]|uniref:DNA topoisomerase 1 n=2 Tax=Gammaproteobacteria TaxID=1236 RepID=A0A3L0W2Q9_ECOLX|nr:MULTISPECIES: type I DNA topoisomerase [Aeromonas]MDF2391125.1 type I DNA topoisomerase [Aeromonas sp. 2MA4]VXA78085.1 DNA topoisomerase I, omega subunit [Aeromonas salmonicida]HDN9019915.1 type I DNA topoisomerase [Aeromonas salmonicida]HEA3090026.1 type I DNA topoisomerase [Aeromonas salmonicida]
MGKSLVIVESPAKAKTINKYLGKDYVVKSSVGHVRDLPTSGSASNEPKKPVIRGIKLSESEKAAKDRNALFSRMGINPTAGWQANYQILPGKEKVVSELQSLAAKADTIYLATDLDREGEAIAWHLREIIGGDDSRYKRVVFNEITKTAIQEAFAQPSELNIHRVNAQQARRFLDRVVGYMVSPLLWKKLARGLSAGRVQSVAVRLIVDKEREIKAFVPVEFWDLNADLLTGDKADLRMEVVSRNGADFKPVTQAETFAAVAALEGVDYKVVNREDKPTGSKPSAPFITSTLQQAASTRLSFGVKKTMMMAQRLYEAGYITYMRTDSTNLSKEAVEALREYIGEQYGAAYLPAEPNLYGSKAGAQEAHEAIRPSSVLVTAEMLEGMEPDAMRLYDLIWRQFVACQMTPAQYDSSTLTVKAGEFELKARGRTLRFAGWTKALPPMGRKGEDSQLPAVTVGEVLKLIKLDPRQHFTKPPARFTEAALVRELEKRGIGRPSTYASIISTIVDRGYVRVESRRFFAEKMGEIVTDRLVENFVELMNYEFTAKMEDKLDGIAEGSLEWKKVLDAFYEEFTQELAKADRDAEEGGMRANQMVLTDIDCPDCGRKMGIRTATTGVFLGCSGYALPPKERCKKTINLVSADEFVSATDGDEAETEALRAKHRCGVCGTAMDAYIIDDSRKLHVCGRNPDCDGYEIEKGQFKLKGYEGPSIECDRCGSEMQLKNGRFGKYMGCTNETCKNTRKILKNGDIAPPKEDPVPLPELKCTQSDAYFVLRDGAAGLFLAASNFPKSRETRAPLVEELKRFKDRLSPKHQYLADAPASDPDGNASIVRFSRKTKEQYVMTEVNGKATGWTAHYDNGKWQESLAKSKKA